MLFLKRPVSVYVHIIFLLSFLHMKHHTKKIRHFLQQRGYMIAFLMAALMVTSWIYTFSEAVNTAVMSVYFG